MSNPNKALGSALEARVVKRARDRGLMAHRQPGSGVFAEYPNDVVIELGNSVTKDLLVECKVRSTHPSLVQMLNWLSGVEEHASRDRFQGGVLVYNPKGSQRPVAMLDLNLLLDILSWKALDTKNCEEVE